MLEDEKVGKGYSNNRVMCRLDAFFRQIKLFRRFRLAFGLGLQTFLFDQFQLNLSIKWSEAQKQRLNEIF